MARLARAPDHAPARCRLCTANDEAALIEELAADLWWSQADGRTWDEAGPYWQDKFRDFAERAIAATRREHGT